GAPGARPRGKSPGRSTTRTPSGSIVSSGRGSSPSPPVIIETQTLVNVSDRIRSGALAEHVEQRGASLADGGEAALEGGGNVGRALHALAVAVDRLHHFLEVRRRRERGQRESIRRLRAALRVEAEDGALDRFPALIVEDHREQRELVRAL